MKSRNTRKINRKNRSLKGGQSPPPSAYANANAAAAVAFLSVGPMPSPIYN